MLGPNGAQCQRKQSLASEGLYLGRLDKVDGFFEESLGAALCIQLSGVLETEKDLHLGVIRWNCGTSIGELQGTICEPLRCWGHV